MKKLFVLVLFVASFNAVAVPGVYGTPGGEMGYYNYSGTMPVPGMVNGMNRGYVIAPPVMVPPGMLAPEPAAIPNYVGRYDPMCNCTRNVEVIRPGGGPNW